MSRFDLGQLFQRHPPQEKEEGETSGDEGSSTKSGWIRPKPGTTILIVDDSKTIHRVLTRQLVDQGYACLSAFDGESAIEMTRQHKPALILMDVVMPVLNGFQATREIRKDADPQVANTPVIIMSGNAQPTEALWSVKIRANAFLAKPFGSEELFSHMETLLYPNANP